MSAPTPYLMFPGTARDALEAYAAVFGGEVVVNTYAEFSRTDGPAEAVAHGMLRGPVQLYAADAAEGDASLHVTGLMMSLLGHAEPATLRTWFAALTEAGEVREPLSRRPWGASDGVVTDRFGVTWLIGFEHGSDPDGAATSD